MWMKPLSLFTFSVFLMLLGLKLYTTQSVRYEKVGLKNPESLFEMEPEKARKLLDDLNVYVKKDKKQKKKVLQEKRPTQNRDISSNNNSLEKPNPFAQKYLLLEEAFMAREDNLLEIRFMQDEIRRTKEEQNHELGNIEVWSTEFIFLLIIQERLGFEEIKFIKKPSDIGLNSDEWLTMKAKAETDEFKEQILKFKGIEIESEELNETLGDPEFEPDFIPPKSRDQAMEDFEQRNQNSREGLSDELRQAEEISFSESIDEEDFEFQENEEDYREPSQFDDYNSEYEYEY